MTPFKHVENDWLRRTAQAVAAGTMIAALSGAAKWVVKVDRTITADAVWQASVDKTLARIEHKMDRR